MIVHAIINAEKKNWGQKMKVTDENNDIDVLLKSLTLEEKAALISGTDFMYTNPIPRLNIPSIRMSDGPHGLRVQTEGGDNGVTGSEPATAFPTAATTASGWNPENARKIGEAIGEECRHYGVNILLGPAANIKRNPLCGRNFEYFSEDPLLAGKMAAAEVCGIQSKEVGVSVKHFALNNSENYRFMGNSVADMRAIRDIYLKVFEIIVKDSAPTTMMCAYNKINGTDCSESKWLLTDVLRGEWGFDGVVMTDWGAIRERVDAIKAQLDLEMPGDTAICRRKIIDGVKNGTLEIKALDKCVENILRLIKKLSGKEKLQADFKAHDILAAEVAEDCAVLMKNDGVLPLDKNGKYLIIGDLFTKMRYQGAGSSMINPTAVTSPKDAFDKAKIKYEFARGYAENRIEPQKELISEAAEKCRGYDTVIVFAGLTDYIESEGGDRENMRLPENQVALIDELAKRGKKIAVVLFGGSPVELPFADKVNAILNMYLPGQNGGTAVKRLLFGDVTPCGKLAETWVKSYEDVPFGSEYARTKNEIYKESVFVGYRYYLTKEKQTAFPFGFGLSYTSFHYRDMKSEIKDGKIKVSCEVVNDGIYSGAEIVQLYVKAPQDGVFKPIKELHAFTKVYLGAGECKRAEMEFPIDDLRYWHIKENRPVLEGGEYELQICSDCITVRLSEKIALDGETAKNPYSEDINSIYRNAEMSLVTDAVFEDMSGVKIPAPRPKKPITLESRFSDLQATFMGRILFGAVVGVAKKQMKKAQKLPEGTEKDNKIKGAMFLKRILESNSLRSMSMSAGKNFPYNVAQGFVELSNGRLLKGIRCFCTKIKVPKLPKEDK